MGSRGLFLVIAITLLPISYAIDGLLSYYDEAFVFIILIYTFFFRLKRSLFLHAGTISLIFLFYLLGLTSNWNSQIISRISPVLIDLFTIFKQFLIYLALTSILNQRDRLVFVTKLVPLAKVYIIVSFFFSIISQFYDLGITNIERYGIKSFAFLSGNSTGFGITIIFCLLILASAKIRNITFLIYLSLSFIPLILTTKGVIYSFLMFSVVIFLFSKRAIIKKRHIVLLASALIVISTFQIRTYFLDIKHPRIVLLATSYVIAENYFPLGTGFATYGSEQARANYSPLYKKYGFQNIYGLSKRNDMFLNDNYIASIAAQTGFFGIFLYLIILYAIFKKINNDRSISFRLKVLMLATILMLYVSSVATGIIKTSNGVFLFSVLAILQSNKKESYARALFKKDN